MPTDIAISQARDLALQKIGRNVVNFQKMEAMLKFLLKFSNFSAPISKGREHLEAREQRHGTKPMGHLVELAAKSLRIGAPSVPAQIDEAWMTYSISLGDGAQKKVWRKELQRVVGERNALIHHMLVAWNPNSIESSRSLCDELDAQRDRVMGAYRHLESVVKALVESHQEVAQNADAIVATVLGERSHGA